MDELSTELIESVEVLRGPKLAVPGIDGVVVVTLKAGGAVESTVRQLQTGRR
jgi:outer membrane receptor protein involved in Fe transport